MSAQAGAYLVNVTVGNVGLPGAPILHLGLVVVPGQHTVSGTAQITQAIPGGNSPHFPVQGVIHATGLGPITQIVSLNGQFVHVVPPPGIGAYLEQVSASLAVDGNWNGQGGFTYGNHSVQNVLVTKI